VDDRLASVHAWTKIGSRESDAIFNTSLQGAETSDKVRNHERVILSDWVWREPPGVRARTEANSLAVYTTESRPSEDNALR
jgi:hypothetical protein